VLGVPFIPPVSKRLFRLRRVAAFLFRQANCNALLFLHRSAVLLIFAPFKQPLITRYRAFSISGCMSSPRLFAFSLCVPVSTYTASDPFIFFFNSEERSLLFFFPIFLHMSFPLFGRDAIPCSFASAAASKGTRPVFLRRGELPNFFLPPSSPPFPEAFFKLPRKSSCGVRGHKGSPQSKFPLPSPVSNRDTRPSPQSHR